MSTLHDRARWALATACTLLGLFMIPFAVVDREPPSAATVPSQTAEVPLSPPPGDSAWKYAPFRADRVTPRVRFSPMDPDRRTDEPVPVARPSWRLSGIVRGARTVAVFEGHGSRGPLLVAEGDHVGSYLVRSISADTVVVAAADSAWAFVLEAPWG